MQCIYCVHSIWLAGAGSTVGTAVLEKMHTVPFMLWGLGPGESYEALPTPRTSTAGWHSIHALVPFRESLARCKRLAEPQCQRPGPRGRGSLSWRESTLRRLPLHKYTWTIYTSVALSLVVDTSEYAGQLLTSFAWSDDEFLARRFVPRIIQSDQRPMLCHCYYAFSPIGKTAETP